MARSVADERNGVAALLGTIESLDDEQMISIGGARDALGSAPKGTFDLLADAIRRGVAAYEREDGDGLSIDHQPDEPTRAVAVEEASEESSRRALLADPAVIRLVTEIVAEKFSMLLGPIPNGPLAPEEAARLCGMSLTTFKDTGTADEIPSRQKGKGTERRHKVYDRKDVEAWLAEKARGNSGSPPDVRPISSGSGTPADASREALASQILVRLRSKRRGSTRT